MSVICKYENSHFRSEDKSIKKFEVDTGKLVSSVKHTTAFNSCSVSKNGNYILGTTRDKALMVWNGTCDRLVFVIDNVSCAAISSKYLVTFRKTDNTMNLFKIIQNTETKFEQLINSQENNIQHSLKVKNNKCILS